MQFAEVESALQDDWRYVHHIIEYFTDLNRLNQAGYIDTNFARILFSQKYRWWWGEFFKHIDTFPKDATLTWLIDSSVK